MGSYCRGLKLTSRPIHLCEEPGTTHGSTSTIKDKYECNQEWQEDQHTHHLGKRTSFEMEKGGKKAPSSLY